MKRIVDIYYWLEDLSLSILDSVLVQIVYICKRISINIYVEIPFTKNPHHTEISQMICFAN